MGHIASYDQTSSQRVRFLLTGTASIVPYKAFKTSDGDILLGGGNDRLYGVLCNRLGKPEWITDDRFKTNASRVQHRDTLEDLIEHETKQKTTQEWLEILEGCGMRTYFTLDVDEVEADYHSLRCDQRCAGHAKPRARWVDSFSYRSMSVLTLVVRARDMVKEVKHPACGPIKMVNTPVKWSESKPGIRMPPPTLGQHTNEILADVLGMKSDDIEELRGEGVIA
jgi:succinate--hydroxymethylglutarate CoA-transferase